MKIFKSLNSLRITNAKSPTKLRKLMNWYGPYVGAGVKIEYIADDWREVRVAMHMRWYNRNAVGTHFGGSLYSMIDPHFMLMLMKLLGKEYVVWDKAANIDFIKPGTGKVTAVMKISDPILDEIKLNTQTGEKFLPEYKVEILDETGLIVAQVDKTLYIRKKRQDPAL